MIILCSEILVLRAHSWVSIHLICKKYVHVIILKINLMCKNCIVQVQSLLDVTDRIHLAADTGEIRSLILPLLI